MLRLRLKIIEPLSTHILWYIDNHPSCHSIHPFIYVFPTLEPINSGFPCACALFNSVCAKSWINAVQAVTELLHSLLSRFEIIVEISVRTDQKFFSHFPPLSRREHRYVFCSHRSGVVSHLFCSARAFTKRTSGKGKNDWWRCYVHDASSG